MQVIKPNYPRTFAIYSGFYQILFSWGVISFFLTLFLINRGMHSEKLAVIEVKVNFLSCQALEDISAGSFLTDLWGAVKNSPDSHTVHVEKNKHVTPEGVMKYVNHSCDSNAKFIFEKRKVSFPTLSNNHEVCWHMVATRNIKKGQGITFDYNLTEYDMAEHFQCNCGSEKCLGEIKGFKYLTSEQQKSRARELSPVVTELWEENAWIV